MAKFNSRIQILIEIRNNFSCSYLFYNIFEIFLKRYPIYIIRQQYRTFINKIKNISVHLNHCVNAISNNIKIFVN